MSINSESLPQNKAPFGSDLIVKLSFLHGNTCWRSGHFRENGGYHFKGGSMLSILHQDWLVGWLKNDGETPWTHGLATRVALAATVASWPLPSWAHGHRCLLNLMDRRVLVGEPQVAPITWLPYLTRKEKERDLEREREQEREREREERRGNCRQCSSRCEWAARAGNRGKGRRGSERERVILFGPHGSPLHNHLNVLIYKTAPTFLKLSVWRPKNQSVPISILFKFSIWSQLLKFFPT